ncbi:MAG: RNA polymerase sigma factor SigA, partial [Planctomycetota bacterium]
MHRLCDKFNTLIEEAKKNHGVMTFQMVDRYLPDEGGDPKMVDELLIWLDENGMELIHDQNTPIDDPDYVP